MNVMKSLYNQVKCGVKCHSDVSEYLFVKSGLIQGEALSPVLFSFIVSDIEMVLFNTSNQSYELDMINLCFLMYEYYDTVLFSENASECRIC